MLQQLTLRDQTNSGHPAPHALVLDWQDSVPLTPRLLIAERVRIEWDGQEAARVAVREMQSREREAREQAARDSLMPLVDLALMRRLNPFRKPDVEPAATVEPPEPKPPTLDEVTALALDGFERNAFFLLVDGQQLTELDEVIPFRPTSNVTFVRLLPLVGG